MLKKYIKTLAMALIMALVFTMFVPVEKTEASSGITQPAIYTNKIVVNLNSSGMPSGTVSAIYLDVRVNNGNFRRINTFPGNTSQITITGVNPANEYDIKVSCDYTSTYGSKYTDWSIGWIYDAAMAPVTVSGLKQRVWYCYSGNLDTVWNKQQAVTGYQYQLYNSSNKLVKSGTIARDYSAYENFDKLSSQTYKMRVRAYTKFNGKNRFGKWSPWLNIVPPVKDLTGKTKSRKIIVKWPKVKGATSYTIFVSTKRDSGWKKTKTVSAKKKKATIKKIGKKKLKKGKYYYVYVRPNKKVGGKNIFSTFNNASIPYVYGRVR